MENREMAASQNKRVIRYLFHSSLTSLNFPIFHSFFNIDQDFSEYSLCLNTWYHSQESKRNLLLSQNEKGHGAVPLFSFVIIRFLRVHLLFEF
mmetsp:Transcript_28571/g.52179  ORF Transcript_28571/g.52179 Transcript_28571/m.52179 type:complete len:93 (-) Transcript_28571:450-728(-)